MSTIAKVEKTTKVKGRRLSDAAYDGIKGDIVRCRLEPGQQVTEEQLAQHYKVGRAAVRAALKRLYQEELVQAVTPKRYMITPITLKYVIELFDLRLLIEPAAARRAAGQVDGGLLRSLNQLCQAKYLPGDHESAAAFLRANTEFHAAVAQASGSSLLASTVRDVLDKVERIHHMSHLLHDRNAEAHHEHQELVEALVAGNGERAEEVMIEQIMAAKQFVINAMMTSSSVQTVNVALDSR